MSWLSGVFAYLMIWWLVLFTVLPWGAHSYHETGDKKVDGTADSAPVAPRIARKLVVTSLISVLVWMLWYLGLEVGAYGFLFG